MSDASFNEQLLTALFDGELQGAERERAEQLLSENSEYKQLFESWKLQSAGLRDLPRYRLNDRFATVVMQQIDSQPVLAPASGAMANWQTGFAAIATLAAMLLLTLFVFPNVTDLNPVASLTDIKSEADENSADRAGIESKDVTSIVSKSSEAVAAKSFEKTDELPDSTIMKKRMDDANEGIMSRGRNDYANEQAKQGARKSKMAEFTERSLSGAGLHAGPSSKSSPVGRGLGMVAGEMVANSNQSSTVEQILWIDMQHREQPMAEVKTVFAKNSIYLDKDQQQGRVFDNRSEAGMEALYVVATAEQMRQAIVELSDQANIAGFQVPQNQFQQGAPGKSSVSGSDSATNNISSTELDATRQQSDQQQNVQSNGSLVAQGQGAKGPVAMAQQLVPYKLADLQIATLNEGSRRAEEQGQELDKEIQEIDSWFRLPNRESDSELVQYLLLVRTAAEDSAIAPASESSDMEPSDEGSPDK